jgi:hypothetical protein
VQGQLLRQQVRDRRRGGHRGHRRLRSRRLHHRPNPHLPLHVEVRKICLLFVKTKILKRLFLYGKTPQEPDILRANKSNFMQGIQEIVSSMSLGLLWLYKGQTGKIKCFDKNAITHAPTKMSEVSNLRSSVRSLPAEYVFVLYCPSFISRSYASLA